MEQKFSQSAAGTTILKGVSRSFYLSLRLLPRSMRDAAGLGYLLARSSDTIADTANTPVSDRLQWLDDFSNAIHHGSPYVPSASLLDACTENEKILLDNAPENFSWLQSLSTAEQSLVREVLAEIISGQRLDLERFGNASADRRMVIENDSALLDYCQRVAGSVGVFWTKLGFLGEGERFSRESETTMLRWGKNFGCGLQLVNILRDRPEDLRAGRYYLPGTADLPIGDACLHAHDRWLITAKNFIGDGLRYADALRGRRLRCATVLPALLALETIERLHAATWSQMEQRVKINRPDVFRCLAEAMLY
jgi:farnesyl-diphosphate farnesyltransferase